MSHATMGGFDIFYTTLLPTNTWSYPANPGYPISTCDEDLFFVPVGKGKQAFYTAESGFLPQRRVIYQKMTFPRAESLRKQSSISC